MFDGRAGGEVELAAVVIVDEAVASSVFEFVVFRPFERPGELALGVELLDFAFGLGFDESAVFEDGLVGKVHHLDVRGAMLMRM